jgi:hypothetical protein
VGANRFHNKSQGNFLQNGQVSSQHGHQSAKAKVSRQNDTHKAMKTCILSLAAVAAFAGAASADHGDLRLELRSNPHGQQYYVYVRNPEPVTTVAVYRQGRGLTRSEAYDSRDRRSDQPVRVERRTDPHGQSRYIYTR